MKIFRLAQSNIEISIDNYVSSLRERLEELADFNAEHYDYLQQFQFNLEESIRLLANVGYPNVTGLQSAILSKNRDSIHNELMNVFTWYKENRASVKWGDFSKAIRDIQNYDEQLGDYSIQWTEEKIEQQLQDLSTATANNMNQIAALLSSSIEKIPQWNGSPIKISALPLDRDNEIDPEDSAIIEVIGGSGWGGEASFSFFKTENGFEIDDVLEAGDTDFFENGNTQSDYFNLIRALRNPSSFSKPKILTLYTARPRKDRNLYLGTKQVPSNIFLTSSLSFAEGFAVEYGEDRDIWKIRIKDTYLTITMDSPGQKQYQVTGGEFVPVESMELLS